MPRPETAACANSLCGAVGGSRAFATRASAATREVPRQRIVVGARRAGSRTLNLYLDASALVKRYIAEAASDIVRAAMDRADGWFACRLGFLETVRATELTAGRSATRAARAEWPAFGVIEVDQDLVEHASRLAIERELRRLDALHLAAALVLPQDELLFATWDRRLYVAAGAEGLTLLPEALA